MTEGLRPNRQAPSRERGMFVLACLGVLAVMLAPLASHAQIKPAAAASAAVAKPTTSAKSGSGPAWSELKPSEQAALGPLKGEWASIDEARKRKWLKISENYPAMSAADQARLHARMAEWADMSPQDRAKVRTRYLEAKSIPGTDRQAGWEAYKALSLEERKALAARATAAPRSSAKPGQAAPRAAMREPPPAKPAAAKRSLAPALTPAPILAPSAKPIAPIAPTVQGKPGATTNLITQRPPAPARGPAGGPKIAASADVIDKTTLLPRAGAQKAGAASGAQKPGPASGAQKAGAAPVAPPPARTQPTAASASAVQQ